MSDTNAIFHLEFSFKVKQKAHLQAIYNSKK